MKRILLLTTLIGFSVVTHVQAQQVQLKMGAMKTQSDIRIDGVLDENDWSLAPLTSDFINKWPVDTGLAAAKTQAWLLYDDEFLYVAAINYQKKSDLVVASLKRDKEDSHWNSDGFSLVLDPINQKTNGFLFGVTAGGAKLEGQLRIEGGRTTADVNWDNKWESNVQVHDDYWIVEMAIPFKSLRYGQTGTEWGLNFIRHDMKRNEYSTWSRIPVAFPGIDLGYVGILQWEEPPRKPRGNSVLVPYLLSSGAQDFDEGSGVQSENDIGLDAKVALSSSLNLDLTINPDFSTVDVDQQVTNLSRFNIFFPERRTFFLENSDLFTQYGTWDVRPFFSRRIGLEDGEAVPILFGGRVTGNLTDNLRIGALNVQTRGAEGNNGNNYLVASAQQKVFGRSTVQAIYTDRTSYDGFNRLTNNYNRTMGAEFNYVSINGRMRGSARLHTSQTEDKLNDASFYSLNTNYNDGEYYFGFDGGRVGDNYITDLGFTPRLFHFDAVQDTSTRIGYWKANPWMGYIYRLSESSPINTHEFGTWSQFFYTHNGKLIDRSTTIFYNLSFRKGSFIDAFVRNNRSALQVPTDLIGGDDPLPAGSYNFNEFRMQYNTDQRQTLSGTMFFGYGGFYGGTRLQAGGSVNIRKQPWGNFGVNYNMNRVELPENFGNTTLHLVGPQAEVNFSNSMFWTTFLQYNTQAENFNINSRFQWRFAPMSDLFIVYNDNYDTNSLTPQNRGLIMKISYWITP